MALKCEAQPRALRGVSHMDNTGKGWHHVGDQNSVTKASEANLPGQACREGWDGWLDRIHLDGRHSKTERVD